MLSAAHCLWREGRLRLPHAVFIGADVRIGGKYLRVLGAELHPYYQEFLHRADLALLRIADADPAIAIPVMTSAPVIQGESVRVVGFGAAEDGPSGRQHAMAGAVTACEWDAFRFEPGSCPGDSGGPVFARRAGAEVLAGLASTGDFACRHGRATALLPHREWISTTVSSLDAVTCRAGDGRCGTRCRFDDPDCPCVSGDGSCRLCAGLDEDCSDGCVADGTCVRECWAPDPDCNNRPAGAACSISDECESAICHAGRCRSACTADESQACAPWQTCAQVPGDGGFGRVCLDRPAPTAGCALARAGRRGTTGGAPGLLLTLVALFFPALNRTLHRKRKDH